MKATADRTSRSDSVPTVHRKQTSGQAVDAPADDSQHRATAYAAAAADEGGTENTGEKTERQVIAVSASKGPATFFNLARKFLVTDEECDLSALEGAIVSALDAAHLLERSKLASIIRVRTSYVTVEPKRSQQQAQQQQQQEHQKKGRSHVSAATDEVETIATAPTIASVDPSSAATADVHQQQDQLGQAHRAVRRKNEKRSGTGRTKELRRARIVITVRRTPNYEKWLLDNPLSDITPDAAELDKPTE